MENFSWKRVLKLAIPLSIISMIIVTFLTIQGRESKLSNGDFIGKKKTEFMDNKAVLLEKVVKIELNDKNYDVFFFNDINVCVGHIQKAESKYFRDIYNKLVKRKGEPLGAKNEGENFIGILVWADGTELSYHKSEGIQVKEFGEGFSEYIKGL